MLSRLFTFLAVLALTTAAFAANPAERGSRDDAVAMVKRAQELYAAQGIEALTAAAMDPANPDFHDRDLYVVLLDYDFNMLAHGTKPPLVGKNLTGFRDVDGVDINAECKAIAEGPGHGWMRFKFMDPVTNNVLQKESYVERVGDDMFIMVGVYVDE